VLLDRVVVEVGWAGHVLFCEIGEDLQELYNFEDYTFIFTVYLLQHVLGDKICAVVIPIQQSI
jgi:hypothetical protein